MVYRRLVRELHPDVNPDDPSARERFDAVQAAFEILRAQNTTARKAQPIVDTALEGALPVSATEATPSSPAASTSGSYRST